MRIDLALLGDETQSKESIKQELIRSYNIEVNLRVFPPAGPELQSLGPSYLHPHPDLVILAADLRDLSSIHSLLVYDQFLKNRYPHQIPTLILATQTNLPDDFAQTYLTQIAHYLKSPLYITKREIMFGLIKNSLLKFAY